VAVAGWILARAPPPEPELPAFDRQFEELVGSLAVSPVGELVGAPPDLLERALSLQHDLAHHHGMWQRTPIVDL